jgi:hypothetical protein
MFRAKPKSHSFSTPFLEMRRFSGLMSRWMTLWAWQYSMDRTSWNTALRISSMLRPSGFFSRSSRMVRSTYSNT